MDVPSANAERTFALRAALVRESFALVSVIVRFGHLRITELKAADRFEFFCARREFAVLSATGRTD